MAFRQLPSSFVFPLCLEADAAEKLVLVPGSGHIINKDNLIKYVLDLFVWFHFVLQYDTECDLFSSPLQI